MKKNLCAKHRKRENYRRKVRERIRAGEINRADGSWRQWYESEPDHHKGSLQT